jgi:exo-poly-alpha-galacturonosidase
LTSLPICCDGESSGEAKALSLGRLFARRDLIMRSSFFVFLAVITMVLAGPGCLNAQPRAGRRSVISEHGAVGDGKTLNTKAIQAAIDDCAKSGGGTVVVPPGVFVTGSIFLKQGVNLRVEKGGVLKGSQDTNDYPWIDTRIAGLEMKWPAALVNADGVTNLQLTGEGTIDGSGERWWHEYWTARAAETNDIDPHFKVGRPRLVHIIRSKNIVVRDLLMKDSAFWNLQLTYCDGIEVNHLTVRAPAGAASSDGVDIDSSRNVLITDCDIICDDDAICLKSGRDADGLRVNRPTENVEVKNCHVGHAGGLVVFGSETSGGIRHVRIHDCRADNGCVDVVRFKTRMGRGGVVEDVVYENIEADGVRQVLNFNMDAFSTTWLPEQFRAPAPADIGTPIFRDITIRNINVRNCNAAGHVVGLTESPIKNLKLENINIQNAEKGFTMKFIRGLVCKNVMVNGKRFDVPDEFKLVATDKMATP